MNAIIDREMIMTIATMVENELCKRESAEITLTVGVSNRHIHLSEMDLASLFGEGHKLHQAKELSQPGYYAAKEVLTVAGPKGALSTVRVLGPLRPHSQVELLISDKYILGIDLPIRNSGDLSPSPTVTLIGPAGSVILKQGVLAAWRHIHLNTDEARQLGLKDGDRVRVETRGDRGLIFDNVEIRTGDFMTELHIDIDEANASGLSNGDSVRLLL